jgi:hypothetical protein
MTAGPPALNPRPDIKVIRVAWSEVLAENIASDS